MLGTSAIGWAVLTATTLSFLGLGVQLPQPDWGSDLAAGATNLATSWWLSTFPGLAITVTILSANFIGDYLMSVLDPQRRRAAHAEPEEHWSSARAGPGGSGPMSLLEVTGLCTEIATPGRAGPPGGRVSAHRGSGPELSAWSASPGRARR